MRSGSKLGHYYLNSISALNLIDSVCITVHELFAKRTMPSQMSYFSCWPRLPRRLLALGERATGSPLLLLLCRSGRSNSWPGRAERPLLMNKPKSLSRAPSS